MLLVYELADFNLILYESFNCNETDHEPTAKFSYVCGYVLLSSNSSPQKTFSISTKVALALLISGLLCFLILALMGA